MGKKMHIRWLIVVLCWMLAGTLIYPLSTKAQSGSGPHVVSTIPLEQQSGIAVDSIMQIEFDEEVVAVDNVEPIVVLSSEGVVPSDKSIQGKTLTITPQHPLPYDQTIFVYIPNDSLQSVTGELLQQTYTFSYRTETHPVIELEPVSELSVMYASPTVQQEVDVDTPLYLQFNTLIQADEQYSGINLRMGEAEIPVQTVIQDDILWLIPDQPLQHDEYYEVMVPAGAIQSVTGALQNDMYTYTFETAPARLMMMRSAHAQKQVKLAVGFYSTAEVRSDGTVWTWGYNNKGQLGDGTTVNTKIPKQVLGPGGNNVASVAAGSEYMVALKTDGSVWTWGDNQYGLLGDGTMTTTSTSVQVKGAGGVGFMSDITAISASTSDRVVLKSNGTVWTWGYNYDGNLGDGTRIRRTTPVPVKGPGGQGILSNITAIDTKAGHMLALRSDGTVWAWGRNDYGQLGDGTTIDRHTPVQVKGLEGTGVLTDVIAVSAGNVSSYALKSDGSVWSWGANTFNMLGDGTAVHRSTPVQVKQQGMGFLFDIVAIEAGGMSAYALKSDGTLYSWGSNAMGELGDGTTTDRSNSVKVKNETNSDGVQAISFLAAGSSMVLALKADGTLLGWGFNYYGQLGDGTTTSRSLPVVLGNSSGGLPKQEVPIAAGRSHTAYIKPDGTVWSWGANDYGQLGDGTTIQRRSPVQVKGLVSIVAVTASNNHTLALKSDGTVWSWGLNDSGQLGDGTTTFTRHTPVQVKGMGGTGYLTDIVAIRTNNYHSVALKSDGTVWTWGKNNFGQLGNGTSSSYYAPVQVRGRFGIGELTNIVSIAAGTYHTVALKVDGTVWSWGYNAYGQLGDGTETNSQTPVQVKWGRHPLTSITALDAGDLFTVALDALGTVYSWGFGGFGRLGNGETSNQLTPVTVKRMGGEGILRNVKTLSTGVSHTAAIATDGTVWSWGDNTSGGLGDGTTTDRTTPVQVRGAGGVGIMSNVANIAVGLNYTTVVTSDNNVWSWGNNASGQFGNGTNVNSFYPTGVKWPKLNVYQYDASNRLIVFQFWVGDNEYRRIYTYDANGNLVSTVTSLLS
ncbi:RCC1 domain-containing protein [Paenibacillus sp. SYP-B4298]|uniref:RCC1 domain-containing protein n=1 Tax=Paenibacillus sp. SYP-B4298 TaxID=2996034 RepID=UPI0022DE1899|nr:Ig-like domain-containing protein [Paenibacillus sp. SYP-B4298]